MIRVAVVGAGGVAEEYRTCYAKLPGVTWALAVDVKPRTLAKCRAEGAQRTSARFEDALGGDIDLVDISTPNHLHEEQACAALAAGKHVLLQKPMATTLEACDRILAVAAKSKGTLGMYMASFDNPMNWEIKRMIDRGTFGRIQSIRARNSHRGGLRAKPTAGNWRGSLEKTGGGSFIQLSIHHVNLLQWWLSVPITEVTAFSGNQYCPNIGGDDVAVACTRFGKGRQAVLGLFDSGYASEGVFAEVYGTKGYFKLSWKGELELMLDKPYSSPLIRYTSGGKFVELARLKSPRHAPDDVRNPFNQHRMFLEAVAAGKPPQMTGAAGRQDMAVVMAVYESAKQGRVIRVAKV